MTAVSERSERRSAVGPMTALRSIGLVARREVIERGRSGYYLGSTVLMLVIVVAMIALPAVLSTGDDYRLGLVGQQPTALVELLVSHGEVDVETVPLADAAAGEAALADEAVDAVLIRDGEGRYELVWHEAPDPLLAAVVAGAVSSVETGARAARLSIDPADVDALLAPPLAQRSLEVADPEQEGRFFLAMIMLFLLLIAIVTYGTFVLTGVVEEKSSRVVEVLLARIPPRHLLAGKVAGIGLLALAQLLLLGAAALATLRLVPEMPGLVPAVEVGAVAWLVVWFVLGYAFYSTGYGAVGALASRTEDAQNASAPLTFALAAGYFLVLMVVIDGPDALVSRIASFVPLTAPLAMPIRIMLGSASAWEGLVAAAVMVAAIYGLVRLAGRVYTGAILRTGRRVKLREALQSGDG